MVRKRLLVLGVLLCALFVVSNTNTASATVYCSCAMTCGGEGGSAQCEVECSGSGSIQDFINAVNRCCSEANRVTPLQCG